MTNIGYTKDKPNPPNNPSADVQDMKDNTNALSDIWKEDHITFSSNNSGTHTQVRFPSLQTVPILPSDGIVNPSMVYPAAGSADPTKAELFFKNPNAVYLLNPIKAFALFNSGSVDGALTITAGLTSNVVSINRLTVFNTVTITVTLNTNAVVGTSAVLFSFQDQSGWSPSYSTNTVTYTGSFAIPAGNIKFFILQS